MGGDASAGAGAAALECLAAPVIGLVEQAGRAILAVYGRFSGRAASKDDGSPVTAADHAADAVLYDGLRALTPDWPVVTEERAATHGLPSFAGPVWLVDPLDGTREFLARNGEFAVSVGLLVDGRPRFGVVHGPVAALTCWGVVGAGAWRRRGCGRAEPLHCRSVPTAGPVAAVSRRHGLNDRLDAFLAAAGVAEQRACGSALKFCMIAAGEADIYPRFGPTMEWDTAAGQALVEAAGGSVTLPDGAPLAYGKADLRNPGFVARGLTR
ncbi:MAG: 3'(2'),5'-bisphosphate nucleotidase CysQ [Alphaproteobacteria bacterium]